MDPLNLIDRTWVKMVIALFVALPVTLVMGGLSLAGLAWVVIGIPSLMNQLLYGPSDWMKGLVNEAVVVGVGFGVVALGGWLLWATLNPDPSPTKTRE